MYFILFFVICFVWEFYVYCFKIFVYVDDGLVWLNLIFFMFILFLLFVCVLEGNYLIKYFFLMLICVDMLVVEFFEVVMIFYFFYYDYLLIDELKDFFKE